MNLTAIIPTHKQNPDYLQRAITSVHKWCTGAELIVVVDREQDFPTDVRATILHSAGTGISAALNTGIRAASNEMVAFLDSDDEWTMGKVWQYTWMTEASLAATFTAYWAEPEHEIRTCETPLARLYYDNIMCRSATMVRRDVLFEAGLFDEDLTYSQDWEMHCRIQHLVGWTRVERPLARVTFGSIPGFSPGLPRGHSANAEPVERGRCRAKVSKRWRMADAGQVPAWERAKQASTPLT